MFTNRIIFVLASLAVLGCDQPVETKPNSKDVVGFWACDDLPKDFVKLLAQPPPAKECGVDIREDGTFSMRSFPLRDPARLVSKTGSWNLTDYPTPAPKGRWMLYLDGEWISLWKNGSTLRLRYWIDPSMNWSVEFTKRASK